jgi:hypothetical protein
MTKQGYHSGNREGYMIKVLLCGILYACVAGLYQGVIMHKPNVRAHRYFDIYHIGIRVLDMLTCGIFFIYLDRTIGVVPDIIHYPYLIGLFFLGWELFEICYSWARYTVLIPDNENVFGLGYIVKGTRLQLLHLIRIFVASVILGIVL